MKIGSVPSDLKYHRHSNLLNFLVLFGPVLNFLTTPQDGRMDDLQFYILFNSISVKSGQ